MRALSLTSGQPMPYISIRELTEDGTRADNEDKVTDSSLHTVIEEKEEEEESESATHNNAMIPVEALVKVITLFLMMMMMIKAGQSVQLKRHIF